MFTQHPIKNSSKPALDVEQLHPLVRELNEKSQESISGVTVTTIKPSGDKLSLVLLFPNPFA